MSLNWDNPIHNKHSNPVLRAYGNVMGAIANWFLMRALRYMDTYSFDDLEMVDDDTMCECFMPNSKCVC